MNWNDVEIFNCASLEKIPGLGDNGFVRFHEGLRNKLNDRARFVSMDSIGCEVRFVTYAPNIDLYIMSNKPEFSELAEFRVFKGNFQCGVYQIKPGVIYNIRLNPPESFNSASKEAINDGGFSSDIWRIVFNGGSSFVINDINVHGYEMRPPMLEEKPALNWLAYGSSITNSSLDGYLHFAARKLKVQVQNKGLSGACCFEKEIVDYMVDECEWDFATCELGINVRGSYTAETFEERARYLIDQFAATGKPVLVIGVFPNCQTHTHVKEAGLDTERELVYEKILERLVKEKNLPNLHFVNGAKIFDDFTGLSGDLLHPCAYGHAIMGANLAEILKTIING
jgi:lysophospholipase L1-like esterase